jgi:hypothetical protein
VCATVSAERPCDAKFDDGRELVDQKAGGSLRALEPLREGRALRSQCLLEDV